jgi:hypothetical protein
MQQNKQKMQGGLAKVQRTVRSRSSQQLLLPSDPKKRQAIKKD